MQYLKAPPSGHRRHTHRQLGRHLDHGAGAVAPALLPAVVVAMVAVVEQLALAGEQAAFAGVPVHRDRVSTRDLHGGVVFAPGK